MSKFYDFSKFVEEMTKKNQENLLESAYSRYMQMVPKLPDKDSEETNNLKKILTDNFSNSVKWATNNLKRQDKIIYFLRYAKLFLINAAIKEYGNDEKYKDEIKSLEIQLDDLKRRIPDGETVLSNTMRYTVPNIQRKFLHFEGINDHNIKNYRFDVSKSYDDLISDLAELEEKYKQRVESQRRLIKSNDPSMEGVEKIISFPNGWGWYNLNRYYCDKEGDAMGHCGNRGYMSEYETILSLRMPVNKGFEPKLTFILNTRTGMLGEMKGFANNKPSQEYHPYIIELLKHPMVNGIAGGGYMPRNNFQITDLPEEVIEDLIAEKPQLADVKYLYKKTGWSTDTISALKDIIFGTDINIIDDKVVLESWDSVSKFIEEASLNVPVAQYCLEILNGDRYLNVEYDNISISSFFDELPEYTKNKIYERIDNKIPQEEREQNGFDDSTSELTSSDLMMVINEYDEELYGALRTGYIVAVEVGTEKDILDSLEDWISDIPSRSGYDNDFEILTSGSSHILDKKVYIVMDKGKFVHYVSDAYAETGEFVSVEDLHHEYDILPDILDIDEPRYGFYGYDQESGYSAFIEEIGTDFAEPVKES